MTDLFDLARAAFEAPDEPALIDDEGVLTFAELAQLAHTRTWEIALNPGDRALLVPTLDRASVISFLALLELRASIVLAHPRWSDAEIDRAIARTDPKLVVRDDRMVPRRSRARDEDVQLVVFTSGSEGRPRGACLSRAALLAAASAHADALPWERDDRWLLAMPLAHIGGASVVLRCLWARRAIVLGTPMIDACARHRVTLLSMVPTMLARALPAPPPRSVRAVLLGGAACSSALLARGRAAGWPLLPTYGLSELGGQVCTQRVSDPREHGVGPLLRAVELRVVDGVIELRGATRMRGYLGEPRLPEDAWLRTGDLGRVDRDGHLHVLGRVDDRIITGGENVDPIEVEAALSTHPGVAACAVVGIPDAIYGQAVAALVVPRETEPTIAELRAHLDPILARFGHPRRWRFVSELPIGANGKLDRRAARASFHADVEHETLRDREFARES